MLPTLQSTNRKRLVAKFLPPSNRPVVPPLKLPPLENPLGSFTLGRTGPPVLRVRQTAAPRHTTLRLGEDRPVSVGHEFKSSW